MRNDSLGATAALEARQRVHAARNNLLAMAEGRMPVLPAYLSATVVLLDEAARWLEDSA